MSVSIEDYCAFGNELALIVNGEETFVFTKEDMTYSDYAYTFTANLSQPATTASLRMQFIVNEQHYEEVKGLLGAENMKGNIYYTKEIQWTGENV